MRDRGSVSYNAPVESAASPDTNPQPADFAQRVHREAQRRGFDTADRQLVIGDGAPWIRELRWSRSFGPFEGFVKVYSGCETTPSSSVWYLIIDDDELWSCGNLAAS